MATVTLNPHAIDQLLENTRQQVAEIERQRLEAVRCPVHGLAPTNISTEPTQDGVNLRFDVCCDHLREVIAAGDWAKL